MKFVSIVLFLSILVSFVLTDTVLAQNTNNINESRGFDIPEVLGGSQMNFQGKVIPSGGLSINCKKLNPSECMKTDANCIKLCVNGYLNNQGYSVRITFTTPTDNIISFIKNKWNILVSAFGDTHLRTLGGLLYDFQATGDFILLQTDPDFVLQARKVSGPKGAVDVSINNAIATKMGNTKVAVCLNPNRRLIINDTVKSLADGELYVIPDGVIISRKGETYTIASKNDNSVRVTVNPLWLDAEMGFKNFPSNATGLLANANGNVKQLATRDGLVLTAPFSFKDLYDTYGKSWSVLNEESLLNACNDPNTKAATEYKPPSKPFYANDLDPEMYQNARKICTDAGVQEGALLDACILDVAVLDTKEAATAYVTMPTPKITGIVSTDIKPLSSKYDYRWVLWLLVLIMAIVAFYLFFSRKIFRSRKKLSHKSKKLSPKRSKRK